MLDVTKKIKSTSTKFSTIEQIETLEICILLHWNTLTSSNVILENAGCCFCHLNRAEERKNEVLFLKFKYLQINVRKTFCLPSGSCLTFFCYELLDLYSRSLPATVSAELEILLYLKVNKFFCWFVCRIALEFLDSKAFSKDSRHLKGEPALKKRHLEILGYRVIQVSTQQYFMSSVELC